MLPALLIAYSALLAFLASRNFRLAVGVFIISLPSYLIRFNIGPGPSTLLELSFGILFLVWLIRYARQDIAGLRSLTSDYKIFTVSCFLFLVSSFVSIFVSDMWWASLGQWRAYFLEPMLVFIMLVGRIRKGVTMAPVDAAGRVSINDLILFLALSTIPVSLVALAQKFTGALYPPSLWDDSLGGRVTSFFTSPNAVGLYLGPLLLLTLGLIWQRSKRRWLFIVYCLLFIANLAALLFTKSLGAWIAVGIGLILFTYLIGYKKTTLTALVASAALIISVLPSFSLAKSQSLANRLTLWRYSWSYLTESPKNFLFGTGLRQFFRKIQKPHYDAKELERLIYPHNIFLNFWTEIGLLGLVGFLGLYFSLLVTSYSLYKHSDKILGATLLATLLAILIHGLIDVPYFKNDLAFVFWIIATIIMGTATAQQKSLAKIG